MLYLYPSLMKTKFTLKTFLIPLSIAMLLCSSFLSSAQNQMMNSDFSQGNSGWTLTGMTVEYNRENNFGGLSATNIVAEVDGHSGLRQKMALSVSKIYTLVFKASRRTTGGTPANVAMNVLVTGDVSGIVYVNYSKTYSNTVFGWANEAQTFTVPANSIDKALIVEFAPVNNSGNRGVIVDDVEMTFTNANSLPVQLISFTAEIRNNQTALNWKTSAEWNNKYFIVERSINGSQYDSIGTVKAGVNNNAVNNYSYADSKLKAGANFYRLRQVDIDGAFKYSKVVIVRFQQGNAEVKLFPTIASKNINFNVTSDRETIAVVSVYDTHGKMLIRSQKMLTQGVNQQALDLSSLRPGAYYFRIQNNEGNIDQTKPFHIVD